MSFETFYIVDSTNSLIELIFFDFLGFRALVKLSTNLAVNHNCLPISLKQLPVHTSQKGIHYLHALIFLCANARVAEV